MKTDDYPHLSEAAVAMLHASDDERVRDMLEPRFISHEHANAVFDYVKYLWNRPVRPRPRGIVLVGEPGAGKTDLLDQIYRMYPEHPAQPDCPAARPVLSFSMAGVREAKGLLIRLLDALNCPGGAYYSGHEREETVIKLLKACDARLLLVDDIQDVLNGTPRQQSITLETLRYLMNTRRLILVLAGSKEAEVAVSMDTHLNERMKTMHLPRWRCDDYLAHFLQAYESSLPLRLRSHLDAAGTMKLLINISDGVTDRLVTTIGNAGVFAIQSSKERITHEMLERARFETPVIPPASLMATAHE